MSAAVCPPCDSSSVKDVLDALDKQFRDRIDRAEARARQGLVNAARERRTKVRSG